MTDDQLGTLLRDVDVEVPAIDWAQRAWDGARARRGRRRGAALAGVGAAAAAVVIAIWAPGIHHDPNPATSSSAVPPTSAVTYAPTQTTEGYPGIRLVQGMSLAGLRKLPVSSTFPRDLAVPAAPKSLASVISAAGSDARQLRVLAVSVRPVSDGRDQPVLLVRGASTRPTWGYLERTITKPSPTHGGIGIGERAISPSGRWVVIAQTRDLLVIDGQTGDLRVLGLPTPTAVSEEFYVERAGFADDGTIVALASDRSAYIAQPTDARLTVTKPGSTPYPWALANSWELDHGQSDAPVVAVYGSDHALASVSPLSVSFSFFGESASDGTWVARGGFPDQRTWTGTATPPLSGLLVTKVDGSDPRMLVMDEAADGPMKGGLTAVGFLDHTPDPTLVFVYYSDKGMATGTWNLRTDELGFLADWAAAALWLRTS